MRPTVTLPLLAASLLWPIAAAHAQTPAPPPAAPDPFDAIRHVDLNRGGSVWVGFGAQLRARMESWRNFNFGALPPAPTTVKASDAFALGRALASAELHAGRHARLFAQGRSSMSTTRELAGGKRPSDEDRLDVHQLYAELSSPPLLGDGGIVTLRGGRFEMAYGRERLVSALDWANTKRSFDGVAAGYGGARTQVTTFWARPVVVRPSRRDRRDSTTALFGIYGTARSARARVGADLYWIGQYRDSGAGVWNGTGGRERRHTVGARLARPTSRKSAIDLEGELAYQFGRMGGSAIRARMFAAQVGYTFRGLRLAPRVHAGLDYASGDEAAGGDVGTFSQLNPQPHPFLGFADIAGRQNVVDLSAGGSLKLWRTMVATADIHSLRRASSADAWYALTGAVARPPAFGATKDLASELDLTLRWPVDRHMLLLTGWSHVAPGRFVRKGGGASGADRAIDFSYLMLQYTL